MCVIHTDYMDKNVHAFFQIIVKIKFLKHFKLDYIRCIIFSLHILI